MPALRATTVASALILMLAVAGCADAGSSGAAAALDGAALDAPAAADVAGAAGDRVGAVELEGVPLAIDGGCVAEGSEVVTVTLDLTDGAGAAQTAEVAHTLATGVTAIQIADADGGVLHSGSAESGAVDFLKEGLMAGTMTVTGPAGGSSEVLLSIDTFQLPAC